MDSDRVLLLLLLLFFPNRQVADLIKAMLKCVTVSTLTVRRIEIS